MKHGKNPTRKQKKAIETVGLNQENWLVCKQVNGMLTIEHRFTGSIRVIPA